MKNKTNTQTILEIVIKTRKELLEQTRNRIEKEIAEDKEKLTDPKYNHHIIQHSISQQTGYLQGIKQGIEAIETIERANK